LGGVLSFTPQIAILFGFLSLLEDCGYMARAAVLMDRPLSKIGLSGNAFICMIMGFGCTVPALLSTRTLHQSRCRRLALLLVPFMPCSARLPIYALFTAAFFGQNAGTVLFFIYVLSICVALLVGKVLFKAGLGTHDAQFAL